SHKSDSADTGADTSLSVPSSGSGWNVTRSSASLTSRPGTRSPLKKTSCSWEGRGGSGTSGRRSEMRSPAATATGFSPPTLTDQPLPASVRGPVAEVPSADWTVNVGSAAAAFRAKAQRKTQRAQQRLKGPRDADPDERGMLLEL